MGFKTLGMQINFFLNNQKHPIGVYIKSQANLGMLGFLNYPIILMLEHYRIQLKCLNHQIHQSSFSQSSFNQADQLTVMISNNFSTLRSIT
ncbi:hypothetical protein FGO68_gene16409 [Halteria grandinella]|uniref:Uncharacterized protein n=1 Tax=Halteria grandinella TaxID=5974 RepID=A0A8J8T2V8_HALGN|nr:hypothetical protein FGO68_gene16409 [Halteria grandinella]